MDAKALARRRSVKNTGGNAVVRKALGGSNADVERFVTGSMCRALPTLALRPNAQSSLTHALVAWQPRASCKPAEACARSCAIAVAQ